MKPAILAMHVLWLMTMVVEGSGEGVARCVVHVDVHGECVMLWVAAAV